ncbi:MAG: type II secretion system protein [Magnetococcales bacterium]|nr:type II secretion system protein [Magnetococcales bacterium]
MNTRTDAGYSLVEMTTVILILGVLASTSLPTFGNFSPSSGDAVAKSVAGAMVAAAASNRAKCEMGDTSSTITTCTGAQGLLQNVTWSDFTVANGSGTPPTGYFYCTVKHNQGSSTIAITVRSTTTTCS